jgi:hypothetical protein
MILTGPEKYCTDVAQSPVHVRMLQYAAFDLLSDIPLCCRNSVIPHIIQSSTVACITQTDSVSTKRRYLFRNMTVSRQAGAHHCVHFLGHRIVFIDVP